MFKKISFLIVFIALFSFKTNASHLMGGEITWDCVGGGQYVFTMKLYRDCNGIATTSVVSLSVFNHPTVTSIPLNLISQSDISPACNGAGPSISCLGAESAPGWPGSTTPVLGAVQESVFQSAPIALPGVPGSLGWTFAYYDCCRNNSISNISTASAYGFTLRAVMYAYNGQNANPCFDSSPRFLESPSTVICVGYPFTYNHNATDPDLDSLFYSWAEPLTHYAPLSGPYNPPTNPSPIPLSAGYSFNSPLPGVLQNPANIPATINPATGEISFTSYTIGNFVTVVKVEAWKCGQLVAEIYREIQIVLLPCATNSPPTVATTTYQDTVLAGTAVNFTISGNDLDLLADGITPQTITISATGTQFGAGFTSTSTGCLNPPCATLTPASPVSGSVNAATTFNWQTSCNHISDHTACNTLSNTYTFVFKTKDDFCPAPAEKITTVSITILALPIVESPQPRCVSVLPNGDVTLTWSTPIDTGLTFNSYHIFTTASAAGPFTLLDSIFVYGQTTYTHVGANANIAPVYYYMQTRSGCGGQVYDAPKDTIASIHLSVVNPSNGTAILSWNPIATPNIVTSTGVYNVYQEFPAGVWTMIGSTSGLSMIDTIMVCNQTINYRVEIADATGCTSVSSIDGGLFQNIIVPIIPVLDTVSVDDSNNALMNWNINPSSDVEAYIIYRFDGTAWIAIDTVFGITNTSYNYLLSDADLDSEQYRIAAYDTCGNLSPMSGALNTIYLTAVADICARSATLSWTPYNVIGTGLAGYRIYRSTVGLTGPYTLDGTVAAGTTTYTSTGLAASTNYYFKVEAFDVSGGKTSSSNRINFYSAIPVPPVFSYLRKVSVVDPDQVDVSCHVDIAASTLNYKIMRSLDNTSFTLAGTVPATGSTPVLFSDINVSTDKNSYYYKIINVDSCGFDGLETNIGRTILLTAIGNSTDLLNYLSWNDYEDWSGNVMSYNIYRGVDGVMDPTPIANVPFTGSGVNTYTDDVSMILQGEGVFNYYVEAIEGMGNIYGFNENSLSNIAEAYQDPIIYIPNAFRPNGFNSVFIPVTTFVDFTEYEFSVFNRWGLKVFSTTNINEGWDGTNRGVKQELGVYVYLVRFKNSKGEYLDFKGSVTLIR
ncbi:MAG: gliding motility-associated C-terminal domain-containing protein [Bacteroidetes bacterium]|nr:gliding motility-associated C-terminal domain-containing protein [Bacteroidota bacterium]